MKIAIVDEEGRWVRDAETDEIGAVCIRGPNVFGGYLEEAHNEGIWPAEGWLNTGDLGRQDAEGYFWLTGRKKELIIRGGHNIDPAAVEEPLYRLQGVQMAAAVGQPDPYAGETPVAYVSLGEGAALGEEEIVGYLQKEIGERAAVPKRVYVVEEIPLTPVGKIFKPALKRDAMKRVFERELGALGEMAREVTVQVVEDRVQGSVAVLRVGAATGVEAGALEARVKELLGRYAVSWRLEIKS
jgi:fatty-acyl-CoA synthase